MRAVLPLILVTLAVLMTVCPSHGWSDGVGAPVSFVCSKCYGTHDFLAEHALTALPYGSAYFWLMKLPESKPNGVFANGIYLYGTEIPDLGAYGFKADWRLHSVYYAPDGSLVDDYAAKRAQESYDQVLSYLRNGDIENAAEWMGITSHYVTDVTSYWHVMGKGDEWVGASKHGLAYENRVNEETNSYNAPFASCMVFDGKLEHVSAYDVTLKLAYDTIFDTSGAGRTAAWMDENYETIGVDQPYVNPRFRDRVCQSLSLAFNAVADLIYSAVQPSTMTSTAILVTTSPAVMMTTSPSVFTTTVRETSHVVSTATVVESLLSLAPVALAPALLILAIVLTLLLWFRSRKKVSR